MAAVADGEITVMSPLESQTENPDTSVHRVAASYLEALRQWQQVGLVSLQEQQHSELEAALAMGRKTVRVTPSSEIRAAADSAKSGNRWLAVPLFDCEITEIVRDTVYQSPKLPASEQYRLVLGTYRTHARPILSKMDPVAKESTYRFKALLKYDPFTKKARYLTADWGSPNSDRWQTSSVP